MINHSVVRVVREKNPFKCALNVFELHIQAVGNETSMPESLRKQIPFGLKGKVTLYERIGAGPICRQTDFRLCRTVDNHRNTWGPGCRRIRITHA